MKVNLKANYPDVGLLIIRVGLGIMSIYHGWPKITGGPEQWENIGQAMGVFGIHFLPAFWGFMAALSEAGGGFLLILGIFFRPACIFLFITMVVAASMHLNQADELLKGLSQASHAIKAAVVYLGLMLSGPGGIRFSSK
ncbi:MAG: DoxX family protein [Candidatus Aureabacteria bacterium]|nr:DoxX family protein [Candidatus Auribacterota bacterium]